VKRERGGRGGKRERESAVVESVHFWASLSGSMS
jgi:hypothetical protein